MVSFAGISRNERERICASLRGVHRRQTLTSSVIGVIRKAIEPQIVRATAAGHNRQMDSRECKWRVTIWSCVVFGHGCAISAGCNLLPHLCMCSFDFLCSASVHGAMPCWSNSFSSCLTCARLGSFARLPYDSLLSKSSPSFACST